jgi:hypothetical protein
VLVQGGVGPTHPRRIGAVVAVILLGAGLGVGMHVDYVRKSSGGRQAFLESQAHRFDSFISKSHSIVPEVVAGLLLVGVAAGLYELIAWVVCLAIDSAKKKGAA